MSENETAARFSGEDFGCLAVIIAAFALVCAVVAGFAFVRWSEDGVKRQCITSGGSWTVYGACEMPSARDCKPTAAACEKAFEKKCEEEADGGTWEVIPFCHCKDCPEESELETEVEKWKREAPRL